MITYITPLAIENDGYLFQYLEIACGCVRLMTGAGLLRATYYSLLYVVILPQVYDMPSSMEDFSNYWRITRGCTRIIVNANPLRKQNEA